LHYPSTNLNVLYFRWEGAVGLAIVVAGGTAKNISPPRIYSIWQFHRLEANRPVPNDEMQRLENNANVASTRLKVAPLGAERDACMQALSVHNLALRVAKYQSANFKAAFG